jgi:hypothetical protein
MRIDQEKADRFACVTIVLAGGHDVVSSGVVRPAAQ